MIKYKPLKSDPDQYDVECDVRELHRLYQKVKDIQCWGRMVEHYGNSGNRPGGFWDSDMAAVGRITASLMNPFDKFFLAVIDAHGDLAIDRTRDHEGRQEPGAVEPAAWLEGLRLVRAAPETNAAGRRAKSHDRRD